MLIASFDGTQLPSAFHVFVSEQERIEVCYHESQQHKAILAPCTLTASIHPNVFALFVYLCHYEASLT